jgi:hypothetical protein
LGPVVPFIIKIQLIMAKTKKERKMSGHRRTHRRKVGAIKPGSVEYYALMAVGALAGATAAAFGTQALQTALGAQTPMYVPPGIMATAGLGVAIIGKGNPLAEGAAAGLLAVGGLMVMNQTFLNVPGISGTPAFSNNAPAGAPVVRNAVGRGPKSYVNQTVGKLPNWKKLGALASM